MRAKPTDQNFQDNANVTITDDLLFDVLPSIAEVIIAEGDYMEFYPYGIKCQIKRNCMLALCGYITIPDGTKYFDNSILDFHGGVTYEAGNVLGFDCAHGGDYLPVSCFRTTINPSEYRDMEYVMRRLVNSAKALHERSHLN